MYDRPCPRCGAPWRDDRPCTYCDYPPQEMSEEEADAPEGDEGESDTELEVRADPDGEVD